MRSLWANIFKRNEKSDESVIDIIRKIPIFDGITKRDLSGIERILHRRFYRKDEVIFHQGDAGAGMFIIQEGDVAIRLEPSGLVVAELHDGEFFGELALLDDSPRSASAIAETDCKILGFFQPDLFGLIERNPRLGVKIVLKLAQIIGDRLKAANIENQEIRKKIDQNSAESGGVDK